MSWVEAGAGEAKAGARADDSFFLLDFAAISVVFRRKRGSLCIYCLVQFDYICKRGSETDVYGVVREIEESTSTPSVTILKHFDTNEYH